MTNGVSRHDESHPTEPQIVIEGDWLTASQAAKRMHVTPGRFFEYAKAGRVKFQQIPGLRLYSMESVDALRAEIDKNPRAHGGRHLGGIREVTHDMSHLTEPDAPPREAEA